MFPFFGQIWPKNGKTKNKIRFLTDFGRKTERNKFVSRFSRILAEQRKNKFCFPFFLAKFGRKTENTYFFSVFYSNLAEKRKTNICFPDFPGFWSKNGKQIFCFRIFPGPWRWGRVFNNYLQHFTPGGSNATTI